MPNTTSAKKAVRRSDRKREQNFFWKRRVRDVVKAIRKNLKDSSVDVAIIKKEESLLYKVVDKAAKKRAIHKNKARRIKSRISKSIAAHEKSISENTTGSKKSSTTKSKSTGRKSTSTK